ncbi:MAG: major facilitator superfamily 1, partial [Phycisphaerales bacterium]|nr:major facilitator superfamily 1 [Phycisphaerales bacterium]
AQAVALFMTSTALSGVVGGPLAGVIMGIEAYGLRGWQWLFLLEGLPSVLLGVLILFVLDDRPAGAKWLTGPERAWLTDTLAAERAETPGDRHRIGDALGDRRVWLLCLLYGTLMFGFYGINYWTASVVQSVTGGTVRRVGLLSAIPFVAAVMAMIIVGRRADRSGRQHRTVVVSATVGAAGMALAAVSTHPVVVLAALSLAAAGIWSALGPFWSLPSRFLTGTAAAAGIGLINSIGNLFGGFVGPNVMGQLKDRYHTYGPGLWVSAAVLLAASAVVAALVRFEPRKNTDGHR